MAPSQVKSDYQLVEYAGALLRNFGPQRVATDVVWRVFTATLSTAVDWPTDPVRMMNLVSLFPVFRKLMKKRWERRQDVIMTERVPFVSKIAMQQCTTVK